jgi:hypothetical protein
MVFARGHERIVIAHARLVRPVFEKSREPLEHPVMQHAKADSNPADPRPSRFDEGNPLALQGDNPNE